MRAECVMTTRCTLWKTDQAQNPKDSCKEERSVRGALDVADASLFPRIFQDATQVIACVCGCRAPYRQMQCTRQANLNVPFAKGATRCPLPVAHAVLCWVWVRYYTRVREKRASGACRPSQVLRRIVGDDSQTREIVRDGCGGPRSALRCYFSM